MYFFVGSVPLPAVLTGALKTSGIFDVLFCSRSSAFYSLNPSRKSEMAFIVLAYSECCTRATVTFSQFTYVKKPPVKFPQAAVRNLITNECI